MLRRENLGTFFVGEPELARAMVVDVLGRIGDFPSRSCCPAAIRDKPCLERLPSPIRSAVEGSQCCPSYAEPVHALSASAQGLHSQEPTGTRGAPGSRCFQRASHAGHRGEDVRGHGWHHHGQVDARDSEARDLVVIAVRPLSVCSRRGPQIQRRREWRAGDHVELHQDLQPSGVAPALTCFTSSSIVPRTHHRRGARVRRMVPAGATLVYEAANDQAIS